MGLFTSSKLKDMAKVAGHIPARISDVPSWDAETIFFINFERSTKLVQEQL
jgi:hypothetical protein